MRIPLRRNNTYLIIPQDQAGLQAEGAGGEFGGCGQHDFPSPNGNHFVLGTIWNQINAIPRADASGSVGGPGCANQYAAPAYEDGFTSGTSNSDWLSSGMQGITSHEVAEAAVNPVLDGGSNSEVADPCGSPSALSNGLTVQAVGDQATRVNGHFACDITDGGTP